MTRSDSCCPDGLPAQLIELTHPCGLRLTLMDWGGTWLSCRVPAAGSEREVLLGCARIDDYFHQKAYLGATVGRYANRIGHAQLLHGDRIFRLAPNQGAHQLHGGPDALDRRRWRILMRRPDRVLLGLESPDGDQGFPGNLVATVCYRLDDGARISMEYTATVDAPCPVNLTNHAYFNLDGKETDIRRHVLQIQGHYYLPIDQDAIPLGRLAEVDGTGFDFTRAKRIDQEFMIDEQQRLAHGYDHAYLLDSECHNMASAAASIVSGDGRLIMDLYTTKPALQFYSGNHLAGTPSRDGRCYAAYQGLALETQFLPDSPNHPEWPQPDCWLRPGEIYRHTTVLVFRGG